MYPRVTGEEIDIFAKPARIIVSGASASGKSFFVSRLIRKYRSKFDRIIVIGASLENIEDLGVTRDDSFNPLVEDLSGNTLVVFDDVICSKDKLKIAAETYTRGRHLGLSSILLTQNLYYPDPNYRLISLNSTHIIVFRNRDIKQISCFARTFLENEDVKMFVNLYKKNVMNVKHGYIMVDFLKNTNDPLNIRTSVVNEGFEKAFKLRN